LELGGVAAGHLLEPHREILMSSKPLIPLLLALLGCSRPASFRDVQKGEVPLAPGERQAIEALLERGVVAARDLLLVPADGWAEQALTIEDGHAVSLRLSAAIDDAEPLSRLPHLRVLELSRAQLVDLRAFGRHRELRRLLLTFSTVESLDGLSGCEALEHLSVRGNSASFAPLRACPQLRTLHLTGGEAADLAELPPQLEELVLSSTTVPSLAGLAGASALRLLAGNTIALKAFDLPPLSALEELRLQHNRLPEVRLPALPALRKLELPENHIERVVLPELPELAELDLARNAIESLEMPTLPRLVTADLAGNRLRDVAMFAGQPQLARLDLEGNPVRSLEPLANLPAIATLEVRKTRVAAVPPALVERNVRVEADPGELEANLWEEKFEEALEASADSWLARLPASRGTLYRRSGGCSYRGGTLTASRVRCDLKIAELAGVARLDLVEIDPLQRLSHQDEVGVTATLSVERGVARVYFREVVDARQVAEALAGYRDRDARLLSFQLGDQSDTRREGFRFAEARPGRPARLGGTLHWLGSGGGLWLGAEGGPAEGLHLHVE
jgi:Leucine-rich repeat (LRR) protein